MAIQKVQLDSEDKIKAALEKAAATQGLTPILDRFLDAETDAGITLYKIDYPAAIAARNAGEAAQGVAVNLATAKETTTVLTCTWFFNELNGHIALGDNPASVRAFFGLNETIGNLPDMDSEAKVIAVCNTIKDGNAAMLAAGGYVMNTSFTAARVLTRQAEYQALLDDKQLKKTALATLEQDAADMGVIVKKLCDSIATQCEFKYRNLADGARRDACRNWGINYEASKPLTPISLIILLPDGVTPAACAEVRIGEYLTKQGKLSKEGVKGIANILGEVVLETTTEGETNVIVRLLTCADSITPIKIIAEVAQALTIKLVAGASSL